jgi:Zn-dependent protease with chaperone function
MDFFQNQAAARRKTVLLGFLFVLAVVFIIAGVYGAVLYGWMYYSKAWQGWWQPGLFYKVATGVVAVVLLGTLFKMIELAKGGAKVALMLGGVPVAPQTDDPEQRMLLNVIEEMALAAGVPVPQVFILKDETGINAFAAGLKPDDAVVAVTRGCLTHLTRDELQGVIAHEFSHILNGDMRLNLRLMGIINGILIIAIIGRVILRGMGSGSGRVRVRSRKGGGGLPILLAGLVLMLVGYIGVFFGKLIKSAISRQREFLADAAAVQFTRNPTGLSGALKKISRLVAGARVLNPHAEEASHFFFVNALSQSFMQLFSTHPPIEERIRRIQMDYRAWSVTESSVPDAKTPGGAGSALDAQAAASPTGRLSLQPQQLIGLVGTLQPGQAAQARQWVENLAPMIKKAVREPLGAQALICCLLFNKEDSQRQIQLQGLKTTTETALLNEIKLLWPLTNHLGKHDALPLLDMTLPALKTMSTAQYRAFRRQVQDLIAADRRIDLFEYTVQSLLTGRLDVFFKLAQPKKIRYQVLDQVKMECFELLAVLAWQGNPEEPTAQEAFQKALQALGAKQSFTILAKEKCDLPCLERALRRFSEASFAVKKAVLQAALACVSCDDMITLAEAELLRAIAHHLDCPVPPILPGEMTGP